MLGKPKFKIGEIVKFKFHKGKEYLIGKVEIVDAYGTFEQNKEPSYDILVEHSPDFNGEPCLYKHIRESFIV